MCFRWKWEYYDAKGIPRNQKLIKYWKESDANGSKQMLLNYSSEFAAVLNCLRWKWLKLSAACLLPKLK